HAAGVGGFGAAHPRRHHHAACLLSIGLARALSEIFPRNGRGSRRRGRSDFFGSSPMNIGLLAMSGVRAHDPKLLELGLTLPGFVERSKAIASLPSLGLLYLA